MRHEAAMNYFISWHTEEIRLNISVILTSQTGAEHSTAAGIRGIAANTKEICTDCV